MATNNNNNNNNNNKNKVTYFSAIAICVGFAAIWAQSIYRAGYDHGVADTSFKAISCILKYR